MSRLDRLTHALTIWHTLRTPLQPIVMRAARKQGIAALEYIMRIARAADDRGLTSYPALRQHIVLIALRHTNRLQ